MSSAALVDDLRIALDPVLLSRAIGIEPDPWQADVLRSNDPSVLMLCCRQSGKSTTVATKALHEALYFPGSLTLVLSPSERQSKEFQAKVMAVYRALDRPIRTETETKTELGLVSGSRIVALPGKEGTVRGFSGASLIIIDEASRVIDDLYLSVRPMLAVSGGRLMALTTPWGKRGWFYNEWTNGGDEWKRVKITARDCPRISPAFLAKERRALGPWWYGQEYDVEFSDTADQLFGSDLVHAALSSDVAPLFEEDAA